VQTSLHLRPSNAPPQLGQTKPTRFARSISLGDPIFAAGETLLFFVKFLFVLFMASVVKFSLSKSYPQFSNFFELS